MRPINVAHCTPLADRGGWVDSYLGAICVSFCPPTTNPTGLERYLSEPQTSQVLLYLKP